MDGECVTVVRAKERGKASGGFRFMPRGHLFSPRVVLVFRPCLATLLCAELGGWEIGKRRWDKVGKQLEVFFQPVGPSTIPVTLSPTCPIPPGGCAEGVSVSKDLFI